MNKWDYSIHVGVFGCKLLFFSFCKPPPSSSVFLPSPNPPQPMLSNQLVSLYIFYPCLYNPMQKYVCMQKVYVFPYMGFGGHILEIIVNTLSDHIIYPLPYICLSRQEIPQEKVSKSTGIVPLHFLLLLWCRCTTDCFICSFLLY